MTHMPTSFRPDDVDVLLTELSATEKSWADGAALFGPGGLLDAQRKALLSVRACALRDGWSVEKQGKLTESQLDQCAHADQFYTDWLDLMEAKRASWLLLDAQRDSLHIKIKQLTYSPVR